jgi:glycosyltransferase involved in cell wall biosynthesis
MKILMQSRRTVFSAPGGDTVQLLQTREQLQSLGCTVEISTDLEPKLGGFDLVHLFNVTRPQETYTQALNAKRQNIPIALSTIYVSFAEFDRQSRGGVLGLASRWLDDNHIEYMKIAGRAVRNREWHAGSIRCLLKGRNRLIRETLGLANVLLPNSHSELGRLGAHFDVVTNKRIVIVPNGVDPRLFSPSSNSHEDEQYRGCVLCVARIEGVKCQLELVRAMRTLPWKLVLVGAPALNHEHYYRQVLQEAGDNVEVLGWREHKSLPSLYRASRVHVLASWGETTGLSSLEAAAVGRNIVITAKGDTREYFQDHAYYCTPGSVESIRESVEAAYNDAPNPSLRKRVLDNFTWRRAAEETLRGYEMILQPRTSLVYA